MSETPQDPWANVFQTAMEGGWPVYYADEVNAARAAVERQHAAALAEKDKEIADLKRRRVTKREQREWDDIQGEALTLRSYIREQGETPMMTASRAERAEADLTTLRAQVETLTAERDELWGANHLNANALRLKSTSLAAVEGERDRLRDRVARALCVENPDGPVSDDALVEAADATLTQLLDFSRSALAAVDAEEELDGPMPEAMRARFLASPETTMRSLVRVTKAGIRARLQAALASPAPQEPSELERLTLRRVQQYLIDWKEYPEHQPFIELARAALLPPQAEP